MHERLLWNVYLKKTLKELEIAFCYLLTCKNFIGHEFVYSFRHKRDYLFILETEMLNTEFLLSHLFHCPFESVSVITDLSPCMSTSNDFNWERINSDHTKICFKELSSQCLLKNHASMHSQETQKKWSVQLISKAWTSVVPVTIPGPLGNAVSSNSYFRCLGLTELANDVSCHAQS